MDKLLIAQEVADLLKFKLATVRKYTAQGIIPSIKLSSRAVRYSEATITEWIQSKTSLIEEPRRDVHAYNRRKKKKANIAGGDVDRIITRVKREVLGT